MQKQEKKCKHKFHLGEMYWNERYVEITAVFVCEKCGFAKAFFNKKIKRE